MQDAKYQDYFYLVYDVVHALISIRIIILIF
jgi:hypothetical protein